MVSKVVFFYVSSSTTSDPVLSFLSSTISFSVRACALLVSITDRLSSALMLAGICWLAVLTFSNVPFFVIIYGVSKSNPTNYPVRIHFLSIRTLP